MKASMAKSIPLFFLAALIPGLANAVEIKAPQAPKVHVQVPHGGTAEFKGPAQSHAIKLPGKTKHDITVNRGVTSNQSLQQWQQGVSGGTK